MNLTFEVNDDVATMSLSDLLVLLGDVSDQRATIARKNEYIDRLHDDLADRNTELVQRTEERDALSNSLDQYRNNLATVEESLARQQFRTNTAQNVIETQSGQIETLTNTIRKLCDSVGKVACLRQKGLKNADLRAVMYLKADLYIQAIRWYREDTGLGLQDAKNRVDFIKETYL